MGGFEVVQGLIGANEQSKWQLCIPRRRRLAPQSRQFIMRRVSEHSAQSSSFLLHGMHPIIPQRLNISNIHRYVLL